MPWFRVLGVMAQCPALLYSKSAPTSPLRPMRSKHATQGRPVALSRQITQDNGQLLRGILLLGAGWAVTMDLPDAPARDRLALLAPGLPSWSRRADRRRKPLPLAP